MNSLPVCTIVSNNYLALARVLSESYREQHPDARVIVCVVDEPAAGLRYEDLPFEVVFARDLGIPNFPNLALRYSVLELNTAVKPFLLEFLRERRGLTRVLYLDPDIQVFSSLDGLRQALERGPCVLTPHITAPLDDDRVPSERTVLMCGVYNLGFVGLRLDASTAAFLRWWQERLTRFCVHDVDHGLFVDQSWMDLAPAFLPDVQVLRDPVYNAAYWNLSQRFPKQEGGRWTIEGRPLAFFHFSGLPMDDLERVSRYQDRIQLRQREELRPLFEQYLQRVLAAGHERSRAIPYAYARFANGVPVPELARRVLQRADPRGVRWSDPFAAGTGSYLDWLTEPVAYRGGVLNRLLISLWEERSDLARQYPDVFGRDLERFCAQARSEAARLGLAPEFLAGTGAVSKSPGARSRGSLPQPELPGDASELLRRGMLAEPGALTDWLNEPVGDPSVRPRLTRLALAVHTQRPDVQRRYPDPYERDRLGFAYWLSTDGAREMGIHASLIAPIAASLPARSRLALSLRRVKRAATGSASAEPAAAVVEAALPRAPRTAETTLGVNLLGHFESPTGVGQVARGAQLALAHAGVPLTAVSLDRHPLADLVRGQQHPREGASWPVTLVHANADELSQALSKVPAASYAAGPAIGYWFWELSHFPLALSDAFALVDEVWAPSRFCLDAFRPLARVPVRLVPPCVPAPGPPAKTRADLGWDPQAFVAFSCFDARSVPERKHPEGLVAAFASAHFRAARPMRLVLRIGNAADAPGLVERLQTQAQGLPVTIETGSVERDIVEASLARCDVYVSLHRSEGLGLLPIEALHLARPVVATAYGGVTDFLDESVAYLVPYRLVALDQPLPPYPRGAVWAEPDLDAAADAILRVAAQPEEAAARAQAGQARVQALYGTQAAAQRLRAELERVLRDGPAW